MNSDAAQELWGDLSISLETSMGSHVPGLDGLALISLADGSVVVDYEININTKKAEEQINTGESSNFAGISFDDILNNVDALVVDVVSNDDFFDDLATELAKTDASLVLTPLADFTPTPTAAPIDAVSVFESHCQSNCYANEILFHPS